MLGSMSTPHETQEAASQALGVLATQSVEDGLLALGSSPQGLSEAEAAERLARVGPNEVRAAPAAGAWRQFLKRLANPLNFLLLALALVSVFTGNVQSAVIIALMVLLSITLGWVQEHRSGQAAQALRALVHTTATVLRRGGVSVPQSASESGTQELPISQLVPGDVVHLSAGDLVPADVRVL